MNTLEIDRRDMSGAAVPAHIVAAFAELDAQHTREAAGLARRGGDLDLVWAGHCERLALICARRAGWWRVLFRSTAHTATHALYALAALKSRGSERDDARFWRDTAADWRARAEGRATSDVAGALSNWHELGVAA